MDCQVDKPLIPLKAHYFLFQSALAAMMPFLPTYARQLGFTSVAVGLMGTMQALTSLFFRPFAGYLVDRFVREKTLTTILLVVVAASFASIRIFRTDNNIVTFGPSANSSEMRYCQTLEPFNGCMFEDLLDHRTENEMQCMFHCTRSGRIDLAGIDLDTIRQEDQCLHFSVFNATSPLPDLDDNCRANCTNLNIMHLLAINQAESRYSLNSDLSHMLWLFVFLKVLASAGIAGVCCLTNAWCYTILDDRPQLFGQQRLWGSFGCGCVSLLAGFLVDAMSRGQVLKDYSGLFYVLIGFTILDIISVRFIKSIKVPRNRTVLTSVSHLFSSPRIIVFLLWLIVVGICASILKNFHFWFLEELGESNDSACESGLVDNGKTLQGLATVVQTFGGEIPMFFLAGSVIRRFGHVHVMSLVLAAFGVRFCLYSWLSNPWLTLPIELMHGMTLSLFLSAMTSYANEVAPKGAATTVQGLAGATYEGVGQSLGAMIGGWIIQRMGSRAMFRWIGYGTLAACVAHVGVQWLLGRVSPIVKEGIDVENSDENGNMSKIVDK